MKFQPNIDAMNAAGFTTAPAASTAARWAALCLGAANRLARDRVRRVVGQRGRPRGRRRP